MIDRHESPRDARFAERIESFGDIVIGFSLAQLALSFTFPPLLTGFSLSPMLIAFGWTFAMTAWLWLLYRRIGDDYFVPNPLMTTLYMVGLAGIVLLILGVQLVMHYSQLRTATLDEINVAIVFYFVVLAATLAIIGMQFAVGRRVRGGSIDPAVARRGTLTTYRLITMSVAVLIAIPFLSGRGISASAFLGPAMLVGAVIGRLLGLFAVRRSAPG